MSLLKKYKNILLIVIIAVIAFFLYRQFFSSSEDVSNSLLVSDNGFSSQRVSVGQEFLAVLLELRSISLDESLFQDQSFLILKDFSQEVSPQPAGRANPFLEIGSDPIPLDNVEENIDSL